MVIFLAGGTVLAQPKFSDPNVQPREAKNFTAIKVSGAFDVYITQSEEEALAVSAAEQKYLSQVKTEVKDGVLRIWYDAGSLKSWNTGKMKLKAYISFKDISRLQVGGACDVYVQGKIKLDNLKIDASGASDIKEGAWEIGKLSVDMSGASDVKMSGTVGKISVEASGASDFSGYNLVADYGDFKASGASDIQITVVKEFSAEASGSSDIRYKGSGMIKDVKTSGSSSISRRS